MAKLARVLQNLFGRDGDQSHFGQFGSRAAGAPFPTKDPSSIQALAAFITNGWLDAINAGNKAYFLEDMNGLFYLLFYQIAYGLQEGIPEWDGSTTYYKGGIVKKSGTFELYGSLVDNNSGNALPNKTDSGAWHYLNPPSVAAGIIQPWPGGSAPFGYVISDGTPLLQASYADLYAVCGSTWDTFRGQASPGAGFFRTPALQGLTLIGVGSGFGLTPRALADLVGEETHTLLVGEMPAHDHPITDPGHTHKPPSLTSGGNIANAIPPSSSGNTVNTSASFSTDSDQTGITVNNNGGGGAHNNMQPSAAINWIIKI